MQYKKGMKVLIKGNGNPICHYLKVGSVGTILYDDLTPSGGVRVKGQRCSNQFEQVGQWVSVRDLALISLENV